MGFWVLRFRVLGLGFQGLVVHLFEGRMFLMRVPLARASFRGATSFLKLMVLVLVRTGVISYPLATHRQHPSLFF